jgi:hypothetical protein
LQGFAKICEDLQGFGKKDLQGFAVRICKDLQARICSDFHGFAKISKHLQGFARIQRFTPIEFYSVVLLPCKPYEVLSFFVGGAQRQDAIGKIRKRPVGRGMAMIQCTKCAMIEVANRGRTSLDKVKIGKMRCQPHKIRTVNAHSTNVEKKRKKGELLNYINYRNYTQ